MENASKALLIAGGIFLAIIIVTALLFVFSNITSFQAKRETQKEAKSLQKFNAQYEAYNKKRMYGADIITVTNKAIQNNMDSNHYINIILTMRDEEGAGIKAGTYSLKGDLAEKIETLKTIESFKVQIFQCTDVKYNENGKICEMTFKQISQKK